MNRRPSQSRSGFDSFSPQHTAHFKAAQPGDEFFESRPRAPLGRRVLVFLLLLLLAALAANLLQTRLGIQNVQIDNANGLTVRDLRLDAGAAVRLLVDAGLSVSDAHLYEDTLEDYFKQVTGGEGIA